MLLCAVFREFVVAYKLCTSNYVVHWLNWPARKRGLSFGLGIMWPFEQFRPFGALSYLVSFGQSRTHRETETLSATFGMDITGKIRRCARGGAKWLVVFGGRRRDIAGVLVGFCRNSGFF